MLRTKSSQILLEATAGHGKGGGVTLYVDGKAVGTGRVEQTEIMVFSADETCDIGNETGSPVTKDYTTRKFTADVNWVEIDGSNAAADLDHLIKPEECLAIAMASSSPGLTCH
ncbi:MAG TPA: hypothetical protein VJ372_04745 [Pyrinomonadaceae bacterium]|jgi:hypothetical protein|nr:hypothetical protein [Pyrinomonadaceae bacterium]